MSKRKDKVAARAKREFVKEAQAQPKVVPADWPTLEQLHGLGKAKEWGLRLAQDLADYRAKRINWSAVDRGCLLGGPPGTGKTTFAKALAATCNVKLVATSYSVWQRHREGHMGNVLAAIHDDFQRAIAAAPCILFIDEIDMIASRETVAHRNRDWWDSIVGALLQELDGIVGREGVVVVAACNHPERVDPALVRAGRLDTRISIGLPSIAELEGILRYHLGADLMEECVRAVAISSAGLTGADVEKLVRDARRTARVARRPLELADLLEMLEAEAASIPPETLRRVAIHEAGHAAAAILLAMSSNVMVSMIRRGQLMAETRFRTEAEAVTRKVVECKIVVALAGRAAEHVILGDVTAGAGGGESSDLAIATGLAARAVGSWGLSNSDGITYVPDTELEQLRLTRPDLAAEADQMLKEAYAGAKALIAAHQASVRAIAAALVKQRALTHEEIVALLPPAANENEPPAAVPMPRRPRNTA